MREQFELPDVDRGPAIYGSPYRTPEGTTVIPVTKPAGRFRRARPLGVFVVADGKAAWHAATDDTAIALTGIFVGLMATTLSLIAVIRRPPWPDVVVRVHKRAGTA